VVRGPGLGRWRIGDVVWWNEGVGVTTDGGVTGWGEQWWVNCQSDSEAMCNDWRLVHLLKNCFYDISWSGRLEENSLVTI